MTKQSEEKTDTKTKKTGTYFVSPERIAKTKKSVEAVEPVIAKTDEDRVAEAVARKVKAQEKAEESAKEAARQEEEQRASLTPEEKALAKALKAAHTVYVNQGKADEKQASKLNIACRIYMDSVVAHDKAAKVETTISAAKLQERLYELAGYDKNEKLRAFEMAVLRSVRAAMLHWSTDKKFGKHFVINDAGDLQAPHNILVPVIEQKDANGNKQDGPNQDNSLQVIPVRNYTPWFSLVFPQQMAVSRPGRKAAKGKGGKPGEAPTFASHIDAVFGYMEAFGKGQPGYVLPKASDDALYVKMEKLVDMILGWQDAVTKAEADMQDAKEKAEEIADPSEAAAA